MPDAWTRLNEASRRVSNITDQLTYLDGDLTFLRDALPGSELIERRLSGLADRLSAAADTLRHSASVAKRMREDKEEAAERLDAYLETLREAV